MQPTAGIPKWRGIGQPWPKSNLTRGRGGELFEDFLAAPQTTGIPRRPPVRNFSPPPKQPEYFAAPCWKFLAPSSQKKMWKTPVAYPWNPLVALRMGEANWWQPSLIVTFGQFAISQEQILTMLSLFLNKWLYSLTTKSLAFSWQKIPYCCCNSRPKFKTQKLWTWSPLRTSCHRSESYNQHIHGGTTSILIFNKNLFYANPYRKNTKNVKNINFCKNSLYYIIF